MRMMVLITLTVATLICAAATAAHAMTAAPPGALRTAGATFVQRVVNVCGMNGCAPVQVQRAHKRHP
jgi:hypothetical protein